MPKLVQAVMHAATLSSHEQPQLTTRCLQLRPWITSDAEAVCRAYEDPAIQQWHGRTMTSSEANEWIAHWRSRWENGSGAGWAIVCNGDLVGQISLRRIDLPSGLAELSYWVLPEGRGLGVASEALQGLTKWSFHSGFHRLELAHALSNESSCRVASKCGFALEGVKRSQALHIDGWHDMHVHARIREDEPSLAK